MFRAMIMWLASPIYEVRLINMKSGKDIPGTRLFKGSFFKARRVFRDKHLKYGQLVRLQAVSVLDHRMNADTMTIIDEASEVPEKVWDSIPEGVITHGDSDPDFMKVRVEGEFPIAEANQRQSDFMHKHQDEPTEYRGEDLDDHVCDDSGALDFNQATGEYQPTCTICGAFMPQQDSPE